MDAIEVQQDAVFIDTAPFQHAPLDLTSTQIRLVKFVADDTNHDMIHCTIQVFDMASVPKYTALSYTWGDPEPAHHIYVDADPLVGGHLLRIRENLQDFLFMARKHEDLKARWFWIDQICIDQGNTLERNHQVAQMAQVYKTAQLVVAWLCRDLPGSEDFIRFAQTDNRGSFERSIPFVYENENSFWRNPYWNRIWICQELALATELLFFIGRRAIDFWILQRVMDSYYDDPFMAERRALSPLDYQAYVRIRDLRRLCTQTVPGRIWQDTHWLVRDGQCADVKDYVYGFIALIDPSHRVEVDYNLNYWDILVNVLYAELFASGVKPGRITISTLYYFQTLYKQLYRVDRRLTPSSLTIEIEAAVATAVVKWRCRRSKYPASIVKVLYFIPDHFWVKSQMKQYKTWLELVAPAE